MKKQIRTNRRQHILVSVLIALVGLGIWISCSKDAVVSNTDPQPRAIKPAVPFSSDVDLANTADPFSDMTLEDRRRAIGGPDVAEKYLRIITKQLARVMADNKLRSILQGVVPPIEQGEVRISEIAKKYPAFLAALSTGFKNAIVSGAISGDLAQLIQDAPSDTDAIYKASRSLFELELSVASPPGQTWSSSRPIPVVFAPIDDGNTTSIEGMNASLQPFSMPIGDGPAEICLVLNFDEDMVVAQRRSNGVSFVPQKESSWTWQNILNSFSIVPSAYAHYPPSPFDENPDPPHDPCYSEDILQPVAGIEIYYDHEDWPTGAPEIFMGIVWRQFNEPVAPYRTSEADLEDLDEEHVWYTEFAHLRTLHGTCGANGVLEIIYVEEMDPWGGDDLGRWTNVRIPGENGIVPNQVVLSSIDVRIQIQRTNEDAWTLP